MVYIRLYSIILSFIACSVVFADEPAPDPAQQWCQMLSNDLLSVSLDRCLKMSWKTENVSKQGRVIPYSYWGEPQGRKVLVLGAIHGDELSTISIIFRWIEFLDATKQDSFLRKNYYLLFPLLNPDGYSANPRTRMNASGVDLNRNFNTEDWSKDAMSHWKKVAHEDLRRYPGVSAASEPETKLVQKWIETFKPDLIISVHAPYNVLDFDGPIVFPKQKGPLAVKTLGAFPGSLGKYAGIERKIPVVTVELPAAKKLPALKSIEELLVFIMKAKF